MLALQNACVGFRKRELSAQKDKEADSGPNPKGAGCWPPRMPAQGITCDIHTLKPFSTTYHTPVRQAVARFAGAVSLNSSSWPGSAWCLRTANPAHIQQAAPEAVALRPYTSSFMRWSADMMLPAAAADQFSAGDSKQTYTATLVGVWLGSRCKCTRKQLAHRRPAIIERQARMRGAIF